MPDHMTPEHRLIAYFLLGIAGSVGIVLFVGWLGSRPLRRILSDFETLTERNKK